MRRTSCLPLLFALCIACAATDDEDASGGSSTTAETDASTSSATTPGDGDGDADGGNTTSGTSTTSGDGDTTTPGETSVGTDDDGDDSTGEGGELRPGPDFRVTGPHTVQSQNGQYAIKPGCNMQYTRFLPDGVAPGGTVILAHGFQGNRGSMAGWAQHIASWGLEVVTPDLCHATAMDSNHAQNGVDLIALRQHLSIDEVVYAGYSAGGLAAFLATSNDTAATAVLGLDMVDNSNLGVGAAANVSVPAHNVVAEPAMCNSSANGVAVFNAAAQGRVVRVTEADHCDFQNPGDFFCGFCSAPNPNFDTAAIKATIIGLSTGFLLWQTQADLTGQQWWFDGGHWFETLASDGIVTGL